MKKRGKRLLAITLVMLMSLSTITGWATGNEIDIVSVTVSPGAECTGGTAVQVSSDPVVNGVQYTGEELTTLASAQKDNIKVTPADTVTVVVELKNDGTALSEQEATFLSAQIEAFTGTLDNTSIQYVNQQTTGSNGQATFTFRPRVDASSAPTQDGVNAAKMGGTDVETVEEFNYMVKAADKAMTITAGTGNSFASGQAAAGATFTFAGTIPADAEVTKVVLTPSEGEAIELTQTTDWTYALATLTINATKLNTLSAGTYKLTVEATGYADGKLDSAISVTAYIPTIPSDDKDEAENQVNNLVIPSAGAPDDTTKVAELQLPTDTKPNEEGGYAIQYTKPEGFTMPDGVALSATGKITIDTNVTPFAKIQVNAYVGQVTNSDETIEDVKEVWVIPAGTTVSYGNVGLLTKADATNTGKFVDAFDAANYDAGTIDTAFVEYMDSLPDDGLGDEVNVLNLALNNIAKDASGMPHFTDAIDYDQDGKIALAEYRIYKLLITGLDPTVHSFTNINNSRQTWIDAAKDNQQ